MCSMSVCTHLYVQQFLSSAREIKKKKEAVVVVIYFFTVENDSIYHIQSAVLVTVLKGKGTVVVVHVPVT